MDLRILSIVCLVVASGMTARAQSTDNTGDITFDPVVELTQSPTAGTLIGGVPADPADWPASFYSSSESGRCTSTLVGPRALLTAAHCVGNGKKATIRFRDGRTVSGVCRHAPGYPEEISADYAVCLMDAAVGSGPYETVNTQPNKLAAGGTLLLTGYGCTLPPGVGGNDGVFRIGPASIIALPDPNGRVPNYIVTQGNVALCFGDSGGGAYLVEQISGSRRLVSVNSRANIRDLSYLSSVSTPVAKAFLTDWSNDNAPICGLPDSTATGCR